MSQADTCVSFIFPLAYMEFSMSGSQGWEITFFRNVKLAKAFNKLSPVAHGAVAWWGVL